MSRAEVGSHFGVVSHKLGEWLGDLLLHVGLKGADTGEG